MIKNLLHPDFQRKHISDHIILALLHIGKLYLIHIAFEIKFDFLHLHFYIYHSVERFVIYVRETHIF